MGTSDASVVGTVFEHCDDDKARWLTLYLVACLCDTRQDVEALCDDARRTFPDWPAHWTQDAPPTVYDIFCHMHPSFDAAFKNKPATTARTHPAPYAPSLPCPYAPVPRVGRVELVHAPSAHASSHTSSQQGVDGGAQAREPQQVAGGGGVDAVAHV